MTELPLPALDGTNPIGFLAALGVLDAVHQAGLTATLKWTDDLVPNAIITGIEDIDQLLDVLVSDKEYWAQSVVLRYPRSAPFTDAKPGQEQLRSWFEAAFREIGQNTDGDLLCALVAEGGYDGNSHAKPTHLHFTAGQQQFLEMVRTLADAVGPQHLKEAVCGPWRYDSPLPSLSWDARGERVYAVRATNPSKEKRLGVPGADWLAFRGIVFYPVSVVNGALRTSACDIQWKRSAFRWPLWSVPASRNVVRSLVADRDLVGKTARLRPQDLAARGVLRVLESPIKRTDQGGYGSFGGPVTLADGMGV